MQYPKNKKYSRIEEIYHLLEQNPQGLNIKEISNEFSVSQKTIQRDLYNELIPLGAYKEGRYWKINPSKRHSLLEVEQKNILGVLDSFAKNMGESFECKAHKLLSTLSPTLPTHLYTHLTSQKLEDSMLEKIQGLQRHISNSKEVSFTYKGKNYHLKPLKVVSFEGYWYLLGLDCKEGDKFKKFILSEINYLLELPQTFQTEIDINHALNQAHSIWFELGKISQAKLKISPCYKQYLKRIPLKTQKILGELEDGSMEIEISFSHEMELYEIFMKHFPHISILSPNSLQSSILDEINESCQTLLP